MIILKTLATSPRAPHLECSNVSGAAEKSKPRSQHLTEWLVCLIRLFHRHRFSISRYLWVEWFHVRHASCSVTHSPYVSLRNSTPSSGIMTKSTFCSAISSAHCRSSTLVEVELPSRRCVQRYMTSHLTLAHNRLKSPPTFTTRWFRNGNVFII